MNDFLDWLPLHEDFPESLRRIKESNAPPVERLPALAELANYRLDFLQISKLDSLLQPLLSDPAPGFISVKLGILAGSTMDHLLPALRVSALRRKIRLHCYLGPFDQIHQEVLTPNSGLWEFRPDMVLLAPQGSDFGDWKQLWKAVVSHGAAVIQQNMAISPLRIFGEADRGLPGTPACELGELNLHLARDAAEEGVALLDLEELASRVGKETWFDWPLWYHAKQAIPLAHAALWGDHVARLVAALRGASRKCLALDLDNTLWGGVIGDEGLEGIELGSGSALGEAYQAFQTYLKRLKERGVILAVSSKNDERNARLPFERHPEMRLRLEDMSCFVSHWNDKATQLKQIAQTLNIGLDAIVFFDDNPVERAFIREALPMVAVPEVPKDPAGYIGCLSSAGYFEALRLTPDDAQRTSHYAANQKREVLKNESHDLEGFLRGLDMRMTVEPFDPVSRPRIAQLVNKSNQFNLTTRRYTEAQVQQWEQTSDALTFQIRLLDRFGDNGMISVVILQALGPDQEGRRGLRIDTWLMSCRVLGRQVEREVLNVIVAQAKRRNYDFLRGEYIPTEKNGLVRDHYQNLGFKQGRAAWILDLKAYQPWRTTIQSNYHEGSLEYTHDA